MADIRINALATTAASTASDDFIAVDGSANGTRKLNAFSPTFGGNLTVSGRDLTLGSSESVIYFGTPSANYLYYSGSSLFLRVGSVDRITIPASTGNVLIGTTTDGGQKLQVSGTIRSGSGSGETLSAGSIDVGADIGIASTQGIVQGGARIVTFTTGNATFAGKVGIGVSPASWELNLQQSAVNSAVRIISPTSLGLNDSSIYIAWASGSKALIAASYESTGSYRPLVLSTGGVDSLTLDTSGNSTFAGNIKTAAPSGGTAATWRLGTVASVSPTSPNRTIEVEIGGTTYYIHAKTTNN